MVRRGPAGRRRRQRAGRPTDPGAAPQASTPGRPKAIAHEVESREKLHFDQWPLHGVTNVVVPPGWDPVGVGSGAEHVDEWLDQDGRIVEPEGDDLVMRHRASDARWVARQWAGWFSGLPLESWHGEAPEGGSLVRTRAVLRALVELREGVGEETASQLQLPSASDFAAPCAALVRHRLGRFGTSAEGTISATTRPPGGGSPGGGALPRRRAPGAGGGARSRRGATRIKDPDSGDPRHEAGDAVVAAKLRPEDDPPVDGDAPVEGQPRVLRSLAQAPRSVDVDVAENPLLAANYLIAWTAIQKEWGADPYPLAHDDQASIDRVIISIGKHGVLVNGQIEGFEQPHEQISAEAIALLGYFKRHPVGTHVLPGAGATPPALITGSSTKRRPCATRTRRPWPQTLAGDRTGLGRRPARRRAAARARPR